MGRTLIATLVTGVLGASALLAQPPVDASDADTAMPVQEAREHARGDGLRGAVFVGNNWDGTATILAPGTLRQLGRINVIPDRAEREQEILASPDKLAYFTAVRSQIGEGHNQYVDDMYSSNNGRLMIVSRPSYADVVAIRLSNGRIKWRFAVDGYRSDHMAISPNGKRVVVSASTANVAHVLRVRDGKEVGTFPSGDSPHESVFIDHGRKILHASIGTVYTPVDQPELDSTKGERVLEIVDARTLKVLRRYDLRKKFDERGHDELSTAVRPLTLSPDERFVYFQVSFFHGFVQMNLRTGKVKRFVHLPKRTTEPRENYLLDSAHHGIAMNPAGSKICVAGTMDDYATVVSARTFEHGKLLEKRDGKPYWVTPSSNGRYCYISWSGRDEISRISYRTERIVDTVPVGDHPQRVRNAVVARDLVAGLPDHQPAADVQSFPPLPVP